MCRNHSPIEGTLDLSKITVEPGDPDHEVTVGRTWGELTSQLAIATRAAFSEDGIEVDPSARYVHQACYYSFRAEAA